MKHKNTLRREILEKVQEFYEAGLAEKSDFTPGRDFVHYAGRVHDADELITQASDGISLDPELLATPSIRFFATGTDEPVGSPQRS